ncbi:hypothetical protein CCP3SC15_1150001 [Gammaproteobacteria bacterium]
MPSNHINVDAWLRHTSSRPVIASYPELVRNAFDSFDLRLAWRPRKALEMSLTGQNLNNGVCDAYTDLAGARSDTGVIPTCQPRSLIGQLKLDF